MVLDTKCVDDFQSDLGPVLSDDIFPKQLFF